MIDLHQKIIAVREQVSEIYHEICAQDCSDLEDLELSICGALNELHMAVEIIEDSIDEECA